jgi:hypothetical protein
VHMPYIIRDLKSVDRQPCRLSWRRRVGWAQIIVAWMHLRRSGGQDGLDPSDMNQRVQGNIARLDWYEPEPCSMRRRYAVERIVASSFLKPSCADHCTAADMTLSLAKVRRGIRAGLGLNVAHYSFMVRTVVIPRAEVCGISSDCSTVTVSGVKIGKKKRPDEL